MRRSLQDNASGREVSVDDTRKDVDRRDRLDSGRAASPMQPADDAVWLDSTDLDLQGVLAEITALVDERDLRGVAAGW